MRRRYHLHLPGLIYCGLILLIGLVAMNTQNNLLLWVFAVCFSGLVVSGIVSGVMMLGVRVQRLDPEHGQVGQPLLVQYAVTNHNRLLPIFSINIEERPVARPAGWQEMTVTAGGKDATPRAWIMHVGPRETVHGEAMFWPTRRGEIHFGEIRIWTTFPFGLIKKSVTINRPQHTLIYPRMYELRRDVLTLVDSPSPLGMRVTQRPGAGDDYYGLREYRENDSVRNIAWKRSATADQLLCIERSRPSPPKVRIILDLSRPSDQLRVKRDVKSSGRELEEQAISLAASLIQLADANTFEIGLTVLGMSLPSFPVRRNHWHIRKMVSMLAGIDLDQPRQNVSDISAIDVERAGVVVIQPDRVEPLTSRADVAYLTAGQLDNLALAPIGWEPAQFAHGPERQSAIARRDVSPPRPDAAMV
jgi:uncharacterized protein (DUF58 family)